MGVHGGHILVFVRKLDVDGGEIVVTFWVLLVVVGSGGVDSSLDGDDGGQVGVLVVWFGTMIESSRSLGFDGGHIVVDIWAPGFDGGIIIVIARALLVVIGNII